jgi:Tol biopolymer transport system component
LNTDTVSVAGILLENSRMTTLENFGMLFSGPSRDKKLAWIKFLNDTSYQIYQKDISSGNDELLKAIDKKVTGAVLSFDDSWLAYTEENNNLYYSPMSNAELAYQISDKMPVNSQPSFSSDGKYLVFYENTATDGQLAIKVIRTNQQGSVVFNKTYTTDVENMGTVLKINWLSDNLSIIFPAKIVNNNSAVLIVNIENGDERTYEINQVGAYMPDISPDRKKVAFSDNDGKIRLFSIDDPMPTAGRILISGNNRFQYPGWSKDGKKVLISENIPNSVRNSNYDLCNLKIININSGEIRLIANNTIGYGFWNYSK